jgi:hypothetical protein
MNSDLHGGLTKSLGRLFYSLGGLISSLDGSSNAPCSPPLNMFDKIDGAHEHFAKLITIRLYLLAFLSLLSQNYFILVRLTLDIVGSTLAFNVVGLPTTLLASLPLPLVKLPLTLLGGFIFPVLGGGTGIY